MIKYFYAVLCLIISLSACKNPGEKAIDKLLRQGTLLVENETVKAKEGSLLFYKYKYSAGIEPIYYDLGYTISDAKLVEYDRLEQFYVGEEDMSGGPMRGIHVLKAKGKGKVTMVFYNKHFNLEALAQDLPLKTTEEAEAAFCLAYQMPQKDMTTEDFDLAQKTWEENYPTQIAPKVDSILKAQAHSYAYVNREVLSKLIDLYDSEPFKRGKAFEEAVLPLREQAPLHEKTNKTTLHVIIE